jgi:hypothetical protein
MHAVAPVAATVAPTVAPVAATAKTNLLKTVGAAAYIVSFAVVHQFLQQHYARTCLGSFWSAAFSTDHSPVCSLLKKSLEGFQLLPLLPALALRGF